MFAHARTAFWYGLQQLPMELGQTVLVPDYICEVTLHPLEDLGIQPVFYPVDDHFAPDWEALETLQSSKSARALLLVHYFGQPQDIERARDFCDQHQLWLLADNAHGYGGKLNGIPLESMSDLGFGSPRKLLRSSSGGILYVHGKPVETLKETLPLFPVSKSKEVLLQMIRSFPRIHKGLQRLLRHEPDYSDPAAFPESKLDHFKADPYSERIFRTENWPEHAEARREAWIAWSHFSLKNNLQPVWEKPHPESCPWVMPVYASSMEDRLLWLRWSRKNGIDSFPWPSLPGSVLHTTPSAVDRWKSMFCFPLHQKPKGHQ